MQSRQLEESVLGSRRGNLASQHPNSWGWSRRTAAAPVPQAGRKGSSLNSPPSRLPLGPSTGKLGWKPVGKRAWETVYQGQPQRAGQRGWGNGSESLGWPQRLAVGNGKRADSRGKECPGGRVGWVVVVPLSRKTVRGVYPWDGGADGSCRVCHLSADVQLAAQWILNTGTEYPESRQTSGRLWPGHRTECNPPACQWSPPRLLQAQLPPTLQALWPEPTLLPLLPTIHPLSPNSPQQRSHNPTHPPGQMLPSSWHSSLALFSPRL